MRHQTKFATIASGAQLSSLVELQGADLFGLWAPTVTSGTITLRGSFDTLSANFIPLQNPAGSGDWTFAVGPGSKAITLQDVAFPFPYMKLFSSVAQTDNRSFAMPCKL
jgi:hypothetical protein